MTRSLRARLLGATLLAALVAIVIVDVATYTLVTRAQLDQVDRELERSHPPIEQAAGGTAGRIEDRIRAVAPGSFVSVQAASGQTVAVLPLLRPGADPIVISDVDIKPGAPSHDDAAVYASVHAAKGGPLIRVRVSRQDNGGVLTIGQPLEEIEHTRFRLFAVLGAGTFGALIAGGLFGAWLVRLGLAPLVAVEEAAADITGSDLDKRVPGADDNTEVGRLAGAINTMLDRLHDAFQQRERDVEALQASEAKMRQFVADASHELRTPLAATAAYAELFERGARDRPEDLARAMAGIRSETARMAELVDDLLLLAQLDEGRPFERTDVDLADLAADAVHAAHAVAPDRHVSLVVNDVVVVRGDPSRLRQVFDNLLANVRAHTPSATTTTITVEQVADRAVVTVSDDGPGLDVNGLRRVTDRFFRADTSRARASGGAGLGLAIVSAIVEGHGGTINVDSPGGLRVILRLPIDRQ